MSQVLNGKEVEILKKMNNVIELSNQLNKAFNNFFDLFLKTKSRITESSDLASAKIHYSCFGISYTRMQNLLQRAEAEIEETKNLLNLPSCSNSLGRFPKSTLNNYESAIDDIKENSG